jgi:hypothetical protein
MKKEMFRKEYTKYDNGNKEDIWKRCRKLSDQCVENYIKLNTYFRLSKTLGLGVNLKFDNRLNYYQ